MNKPATAIMWIGLFLITMLVVTNWKTIVGTIF